jgi:hypothetical protein
MRKPVKAYWLVAQRATVWFSADENNVVVDASPLARSFRGQGARALHGWLKLRFGGPVAIEGSSCLFR